MGLGKIIYQSILHDAKFAYCNVSIIELAFLHLARNYPVNETGAGLQGVVRKRTGSSLDTVAEHKQNLGLCAWRRARISEIRDILLTSALLEKFIIEISDLCRTVMSLDEIHNY